MTFEEMSRVIDTAKHDLMLADNSAGRFARLLLGRLRKVGPSTLRDLKRELSLFDAKRGEWKR